MWAKVVSVAKKGMAAKKVAQATKNNNSSEKEDNKTLKTVAGFGCLGGLLIIFALIACLVVLYLAPLFHINDLLSDTKFGKVADGFETFTESLGNFLTFQGWCTDEKCQEREETKFYEDVEDIARKYNKTEEKLNVNLLVATLTYVDPSSYTYVNIEGDITATDEDEKNTLWDWITSLFENEKDYEEEHYVPGTDYRKTRRRTKRLAKALVMAYEEYQKDYKNNPNINLKDYYSKPIGDFARLYFFDNDDVITDDKINRIIEDIYARVDFYNAMNNIESIGKYTKVYAYCNGVQVVNSSGKLIGTFPLEEYVAGVVSAEGKTSNMEALKAQAIVARTYVLAATNNCKTSIANTSSVEGGQNFTPNITDKARQAAKETENSIMLYDESIFVPEYELFCIYDQKFCEPLKPACDKSKDENSDACNKYNACMEQCSEENDLCKNSWVKGDIDTGVYYSNYLYTPLDDKNTNRHEVELRKYQSTIKNNNYCKGNGKGMSKLVSYELADAGLAYDAILRHFYGAGKIEITEMKSVLSMLYDSISEVPGEISDLYQRALDYNRIGIGYIGDASVNLGLIYKIDASNLGQCVWYARSRALELIYYSNMSDAEKYIAYEAIASTNGHGRDWYSNPSGSIFEKSTNYAEPRPGAIVSWSGGDGHNYGHVAIIESVDMENRTVVMSDGYNGGGANGAPTWANVRYRTRTLTFEQIKNYGNGNYRFNGYVYILGKG